MSHNTGSSLDDSDGGLMPDITLSSITRSKKHWHRETSPLLSLVEHEYSVFKNIFPDDPEFQEIIRQAEYAIAHSLYPERISKGSSGSYFVKKMDGSGQKIIGVFKPKDEEPYGSLNPNCTKWMHGKCCPCCFGRSCLVPNHGYLSEAGASLVDRKLQLDIVPKTRVVKLISDSFNYSTLNRTAAYTKKNIIDKLPTFGKHFNHVGLPPKTGSFQLYVEGYEDADYWLRRFDQGTLPKLTALKFQFQFEKLVVLDYIIRNTDRNNDNWLIKYEAANLNNEQKDDWSRVHCPDVSIAAIDNGLAFPMKHPDEWRTYPYHWAWLAQAKVPFSQDIKDLILPRISNACFVQELCDGLFDLFSAYEDFDPHIFDQQVSIIRGQVLNLKKALEDSRTPAFLVTMPVGMVLSSRKGQRHKYQSDRSEGETFTQRIAWRRPVFSWC